MHFVWFETSASSLASGSNTAAVLGAIKVWNAAIAVSAFTSAQQQLMADQSKHWHLTEATAGSRWALQEMDADRNPVGAARDVDVLEPGISTSEPVDGVVGELYALKVTSRTPQTVRYEITSGVLAGRTDAQQGHRRCHRDPCQEGRRHVHRHRPQQRRRPGRFGLLPDEHAGHVGELTLSAM